MFDNNLSYRNWHISLDPIGNSACMIKGFFFKVYSLTNSQSLLSETNALESQTLRDNDTSQTCYVADADQITYGSVACGNYCWHNNQWALTNPSVTVTGA